VIKDIIYGITIPRIEKTGDMIDLSQDIPNLLIISIDTLRSDYLGIYKDLEGQPYDHSFSPNMDLFCKQAVVFKKAYTPLSSTWPALASMHTSLYPCEHGVLYNRQQMSRYCDTLATHMLELGFNTLSLHGNASGLNVPGIEEKYHYFNDDMAVIQSALPKLKRDSDRPFFHWYHFIGVHSNYKPPEWVMTILAKDEPYRFYDLDAIMSGDKKIGDHELDYIRKLYAGELFNLDREMDKIFNYLKINGLWENTMVVITADHGEDLYQHHDHFYHYPSLYETSLRVPLMIKFPQQKKQIIVEEPVSLLDIFPTIAEYFQGEEKNREHEYFFSGLSLMPLLRGEKRPYKERALFAGAEDFDIISILDNDWKLIHNPKKIQVKNEIGLPFPYKEFELYQPEGDFLEEYNRYEDNLHLIRKLTQKIALFEKEHKRLKGSEKGHRTKTTKKFKKETVERLKALGYIK
jgi:arylsulfatase